MPTQRNTVATLPPPPAQTSVPPTRSGNLSATSQPTPPGWTPTPPPGVKHAAQARDPRYAAWEAMMVGCGPVDRRAWADPSHAFQLTVQQRGRPGVGVMLQFASPGAAGLYQFEHARQLRRCPAGAEGQAPGVTVVENRPGRWIGQRSYASGERWSEIVVVRGSLVRLWILQDGGTSTPAQLRQLAARL